tara:strand:- start:70 stop:303 length:234 start_codon:yes stop_codon:yes gene_type:complete
MKYKIGQKVKYFADDTEEWFDGVIEETRFNKNTNEIDYLVFFNTDHYWVAESLLNYPHETEGSDLKISNMVTLCGEL